MTQELKQAAQAALEQLEFLNACYPHKTATDVADALRTALSQQPDNQACKPVQKRLEAQQPDTPEPNPWREAVDDALTILHASTPEDPREAVMKLVALECQIALDPDVSQQAAALVQRGRDDGLASSVTCSRCGTTAMSHDMRNAW